MYKLWKSQFNLVSMQLSGGPLAYGLLTKAASDLRPLIGNRMFRRCSESINRAIRKLRKEI
jgi:hypothetical protein